MNSLLKFLDKAIKIIALNITSLGIFLFLLAFPSLAHHPWEGEIKTFGFSQGLLSGLAHPILGVDHLLFLLSIGLVGGLCSKQWVPLLLLCGTLGSFLSQITPSVNGQEVLMGLSLVASALVSLGHLRSVWMIPLITSHGYVLGQTMIGAEPAPLAAYLIGLLIAETFIVLLGIMTFKNCLRYKRVFAIALMSLGIVFTYGSFVALV